MITSFNSKMFIFKNISKWFVIFLACFVLSGNPILTINNGVDLIPQINVRELVWLLMGKAASFAYLSTSVTFICVSVISAFFYKCLFLNRADFSCEDTEDFSEKKSIYFLIMGFTNPFLHSCKTKGLRE